MPSPKRLPKNLKLELPLLAEEVRSFLSTRRARLTPAEAGVSAGFGTRRVPGLRRDELAAAADISVEYYSKLEQGRIHNPSLSTLASVARALKLNQSENHYLHLLFRKDEPGAESGSRGARVALRALVHALTDMPAFLMDQKLDIVELNQPAETLIFGKPSLKPMNLARSIFSDPRSRSRYVDWREKAEDTVAILRFARAKFPYDAAIPELIDELRHSGAAFRHIWAKHGVLEKKNGQRRLYDSKGGIVDTYYETMTFPADPHLTLVIYLPKTDTPVSSAVNGDRNLLVP
jgi:transcriptional regulator with XRE-family HTH domain